MYYPSYPSSPDQLLPSPPPAPTSINKSTAFRTPHIKGLSAIQPLLPGRMVFELHHHHNNNNNAHRLRLHLRMSRPSQHSKPTRTQTPTQSSASPPHLSNPAKLQTSRRHASHQHVVSRSQTPRNMSILAMSPRPASPAGRFTKHTRHIPRPHSRPTVSCFTQEKSRSMQKTLTSYHISSRVVLVSRDTACLPYSGPSQISSHTTSTFSPFRHLAPTQA